MPQLLDTTLTHLSHLTAHRPTRLTTLRISTLLLNLLAIILISPRASTAINGSYADDGAATTLVLLVYIAIGCSMICELPLLLVPHMRIFRRAFPFRSAVREGQVDTDADAHDTKPRMHPALVLTIELLSFFTVLALQIMSGVFGHWAFDDALLTISWVLVSIVTGLQGWLFGLACRDVHRLRKEQKMKRASLRSQAVVVLDDEEARTEGLQGWVELTEQDGDRMKKSGGVGGGLSGVGKGY